MPGQRSVILISPGFLTLADLYQDKTEIIDRAIRANVIINAVNARGPVHHRSRWRCQPAFSPELWAPTDLALPISTGQRAGGRGCARRNWRMARAAHSFTTTTTCVDGFKRVAARPEFRLCAGLLAAKSEARWQASQVESIPEESAQTRSQARTGYYAPQHLTDPAETAKQEIQDALFSREELRDIPVAMHTQFFKPSVEDARLAVLARVDVRHLRFRKENGRNRDDLTVVSGLFDRNGNLVTGNSKTVEMRLKDQTLETDGSTRGSRSKAALT